MVQQYSVASRSRRLHRGDSIFGLNLGARGFYRVRRRCFGAGRRPNAGRIFCSSPNGISTSVDKKNLTVVSNWGN